MNAKKYVDKFLALEEAAKNEIIELLKYNPKGRFIQPHDEDDDLYDQGVMTMTGDEDIIICAVGLFDDDDDVELRIKASLVDGGEYSDNEWFIPDDFTQCYCVLYEFVVNNLDRADQEPLD